MLLISILIAIICSIINICTNTNYLWCLIVLAGILYSWVTVLYSIKRNINIASSVMIQFIAISVLTIWIDYILGYKGWAINLAIPIIIMVANITILVLVFVSIHRYYNYAIYHFIIFIASMVPLLLYLFGNGIILWPIFTIISSSIAVFTFILSLILCGRSMIEELDRRLHM